MASKTSSTGLGTFLLSLIGWSLISKTSPKKRSFSPMEKEQIKQTIIQRLTAPGPLGLGLSSRHAMYWLAVSSFETAQWTSNLCVNYNNYFGMKWSGRSNQVSLAGSVWAFPADLLGSLDLQMDYIKRMGYPKDFPDLATFCQYMKLKKYFQEDYASYYAGLVANLNLVQ